MRWESKTPRAMVEGAAGASVQRRADEMANEGTGWRICGEIRGSGRLLDAGPDQDGAASGVEPLVLRGRLGDAAVDLDPLDLHGADEVVDHHPVHRGGLDPVDPDRGCAVAAQDHARPVAEAA